MAGDYSPAEVTFLLSLDEETADLHATAIPSVLGGFSGESGPSSADDAGVPLLPRWNDVHGARERVKLRKRDAEILELRVAGEGEREVARLVGASKTTVHRRFRASIEEILEELEGEGPS